MKKNKKKANLTIYPMTSVIVNNAQFSWHAYVISYREFFVGISEGCGFNTIPNPILKQ